MHGKNIQDKHGAVDHAHIRFALDIALLRRRQLAVKDQQVDRIVRAVDAQLFKTAFADIRRAVGTLPFLHERRRHVGAGRFRQLRQLPQRAVHIIFARIHADKHCALRLQILHYVLHHAYPFGFCDCQRHVSSHISATPRSAFHPNSRAALDASA